MKPDKWEKAMGGLSPKCMKNGTIFIDQDTDGNIVIDNGEVILGVLSIDDLNKILSGIRYIKVV